MNMSIIYYACDLLNLNGQYLHSKPNLNTLNICPWARYSHNY